MLFIAHRINTRNELQHVPTSYGVEIDIRDTPSGDLILQHDPFPNITTAERFIDWLTHYSHAFLILNIKSEGIEWRVKELLQTHNITEYMFLDCTIPMIQKMITKGETNIAIRYSEVEPIELAQQFIGKVKWLWVDCFTNYPSLSFTKQEKDQVLSKFKLCLVSPTLQGRSVTEWQAGLPDSTQFDAVCEKIYNAKYWLKDVQK